MRYRPILVKPTEGAGIAQVRQCLVAITGRANDLYSGATAREAAPSARKTNRSYWMMQSTESPSIIEAVVL
jgi:hypothetical protein